MCYGVVYVLCMFYVCFVCFVSVVFFVCYGCVCFVHLENSHLQILQQVSPLWVVINRYNQGFKTSKKCLYDKNMRVGTEDMVGPLRL